MSHLKTERRKKNIFWGTLMVLVTVIGMFFIYSLKSDYHASDDYIQKSMGQELKKINSNGQPVDIERATALIKVALDRTYENYIISVLYFLLLVALGVICMVSIVIIKLKE